MTDIDLRAALICARHLASLHHPNHVPPRWLSDHLRHLEAIANSSATATKEVVRQQESIGTTEAARILGYSTSYTRRIAQSLDGHRIGKTWTFPRKVIEDYAQHLAGRRAA